ncbi:MAG: phosphoribosylformylglycinamidine synthase subunit PurL [Actinomycetota bacterium]|nr:phosphoribosylformylglycinamidine synthase subunit PurL [Actinomycetota bacterium]
MTDDELSAIIDLLGRDPSDLELAMYSVMWSEHCSYKSSRKYLGRFPTEAPWVLVGPGEGAGVIDVGDGLAVALRIESHNHPSAVEPHQGAATGVGGIIRDIFSMGARPIALMDPLRFGPLDTPRNRYLVEGVVSGISSYGNSVGVPTVGGEIVFDPCYSANPLVNVFCLGVLPKTRLVLARAEGEGNLAVLLGASTGRDGIGGASVLASAGFDEPSTIGPGADKRPSVQVGDPFEEKKLIEACLALLDSGLAVGVQDLGAGGLSCAASETAAKAGMGMDVDLARVPRREPGMSPMEVMISESQERMLAIVTPEDLSEVLALCERWEIRASVVGRVTTTGRFRVYDGAFDAWGVPPAPAAAPSEDGSLPTFEVLCDVPGESLGDGPVYDRPVARPADQDSLVAADPLAVLAQRFPAGADAGPELLGLLSLPNIGDSSWVWRQYDHELFLNTVAGPGCDAAVLRLRETLPTPGDTPGSPGKALALTTDGKARFCLLDPRTGAALAVLEAARNVACTGARPMALVNCLNFGNPEHPEVMWQFSEVVDGMSDACRALGLPVIGGNVSFYNESGGADIHPTPVVGVVGLIDRLDSRIPPAALSAGEVIVVLGDTAAELGGSEWAAGRHGLLGGMPPSADLAAGVRLHELVAALVGERAVAGVHDCSDGGLAVALAEMAIGGGCGFTVAAEGSLAGLLPAAACFSESANRVVLAVETGRVDEILGRAAAAGVPAAVLGTAGGGRLVWTGAFDVSLADAETAWRDALPSALAGGVTPVG